MATAAKFDADFSQFIGELNKVEIQLADFDPSVKRAGDAARKLADSLNGNRIAEQAQVALRAIQSIEGGVSALTKGEAKRMGAIFDEFVEKSANMGRKVPADMQAVKASLDAVRASADEVKKSAPDGESFGALFKQGIGIGAGMTAANAAVAVVGELKNQFTLALQEGQKLSQLGTAFTNLQGGAGNASRVLGDLRGATRGLVTDVELMQAANKASLLGLNEMGISTERLAGVAVKLGKAMGQDAAKSVDDLTTALARQSPMILDNLGIKVKLSEANAAYALSIGKSESALTEEERKLAFATAAMDAADAKVRVLGEQTLTFGEQVTRLSTTFENLRAEIGKTVNESGFLASATGRIADALDEATEASGDLIDEWNRLTEAEEDYKLTSDGVNHAILYLLIPPAAALSDALNEQAEAARNAKKGLKEYGAVRDWFMGKSDIDPESFSAPAPPAGLLFSKQGRDRTLGGSMGGGARVDEALKAEEERRKKALEEEQRRLETMEDELRRAGEQKRKAAQAQALADAKAYQKQLQDLTGETALKATQLLDKQIGDITRAGKRLTDAAAASAWNTLWDARKIAQQSAPELVKGIEASMRTLATHPGVIAEAKKMSAKFAENLFDPDALKKGAIKGINTLATDATLSTVLSRAIGTDGLRMGTVNGKPALQNVVADTYALKKGLEGIGMPMSVINERFDKSIKSSSDLLTKVSALSTAFSNMANIGGDAFGGIAQGMGEAVAAVDASMKTVDLLGSAFFGKDEGFAKTGKGKALGGALVGLQMGATFGAMAGSPWKGAAAGAASGAAGGAMYGGWGALIGAGAGAISGYFAGRKAQKQAREAMQENRRSLLELYGTKEDLIRQATRLGISEEEVRRNILNNEKDTKAYSKTLDKITEATSREEKEAEKLAKTLGDVTRARGVLDMAQTKQLRSALALGEGPMTEAAEAFLDEQRESLLDGLQRTLDSGGLSPALVGAIGDSLPAAFAELQRSGLSAIDALRMMEPILQSFQTNAVNAGLGSAEGFDKLNASLGILNDEKLGPLVDAAQGASQVMAALQNLGYGNEAAFSGFAASITDAFTALQEGAGTDQALMLLHQPLQNLWQLTKDFGYEVDENTARMLEQAEAAGTVGDKFRPASERAAAALDKVVEKLDEIIGVFKGDMVTSGEEGANEAGQRIVDTFAKYQPVVRVRYEYEYPNGEVMPPGDPTRGAAHARDATGGGDGTGDIYMDGERVGFIVGRHLGTVSDYAGA